MSLLSFRGKSVSGTYVIILEIRLLDEAFNFCSYVQSLKVYTVTINKYTF
jgi:hypothetical protein